MFPDNATTSVLFLIAFIGLCAAYKLVQATGNLKAEEARLQEWRRLVTSPDERLHSQLEQFGVPHLVPARGKRPEGLGVTDRAVKAVWRARETQVDLEAISSMIAQKESGRLSFPSIVPNLAMLIGLFGTVLGLIQTIPVLGEQFGKATTSADAAQLGRSMNDALGHMSSAMFATLGGVLAAMIIGFWTRHVAGVQDKFLADLQDFIVSELGPRILPQQSDQSLENLSQAISEMRIAISTMPEIMEKAASSFTVALEQSSVRLGSTLEGVTTLANTINRSLAEASENVRQSSVALTTSATVLQSSTDQLKEQHLQNWAEAETARREMKEQLDTQLGHVLLAFQTTQSSISENTNVARKFVDGTHEKLDEYRASVQGGFAELLQQVSMLLGNYQLMSQSVADELRSLAGTLKDVGMERTWKDLGEEVKKLAAASDSLDRSVGQLRPEILDRALANLADRIQNVSITAELASPSFSHPSAQMNPMSRDELAPSADVAAIRESMLNLERQVARIAQQVAPYIAPKRPLLTRLKFWQREKAN